MRQDLEVLPLDQHRKGAPMRAVRQAASIVHRPNVPCRLGKHNRRGAPPARCNRARNRLSCRQSGKGPNPMPDAIMPVARVSQETEHFDVLIVGAGISGVGAAYHLTKQCPGTSFVALELQDTFGGTWITHRYPGIRSDSDLYTFGYRFKPWTGAPIASAAEILRYMGEVIKDNGLAPHIRYRRTLSSASWSSRDNRWTLEGIRTDTGEAVRFTANFLWMCQGYYRHSEGYTPEWPGMEEFKGPIVHPERWPDNLDYKNKNIVVIGSGATAATLIPAMAEDCGHITMLQRS